MTCKDQIRHGTHGFEGLRIAQMRRALFETMFNYISKGNLYLYILSYCCYFPKTVTELYK